MTNLDVARFHVENGPAALFERLMQVFAQPRRSTELTSTTELPSAARRPGGAAGRCHTAAVA